MDIVFVHGWGSGPFLWQDIIEEFSEHNCHVVNLGFVGDEDIKLPDGKFIGIGHSLGGLWLLKHYPERLLGFVSIGSFSCFYKHIPQQILAKMQKNIIKDTTAQLSEFWHHAGLDKEGGFKNLNPLKLVEGLTWLSRWKTEVPENVPVKILASHDDNIVPAKMTKDVWQNFDIEWIENGGHMLPLTQPKWCIENIKSFIDGVK